jgi:hypothetical protein
LCIGFVAAAAVFPPTDNNYATKETIVVVEEVTQAKPLIDIPLNFSELDYNVFYDIQLSIEYIDKLNASIQTLNEAINSAEYTSHASESMLAEVMRLQDIVAEVENDIERYNTWEQEYYFAAKTYEFFMQQGFSEVITSAIIGNMMIETSGGTLNLNPTVYSSGGGFYGLCQWSLYYRPHVSGMSFEDQLVYLLNDLEYEFNTFGFCYKKNFKYDDFLTMEDPGAAALAFAKAYERCGSGSYGARQRAAVKAYNYFVKGE